jgi:hypothetical protein
MQEINDIIKTFNMNFKISLCKLTIFFFIRIIQPTKNESKYEIAVPIVMAKIPRCGIKLTEITTFINTLKNVMYIGVLVLE